MKWWEILLEILKYTVPALVVFATAYYLIRQHLQSQLRLRSMELKQETTNQTINLKMQAYERLSLFCERISVPQLIYRIPGGELSSDQYKSALIMAIQQEYEHNFSQQIYVSDKLWKIVDIAKEQVVEIIDKLCDSVPVSSLGSRRSAQLLDQYQTLGVDPTRMALEAIKKEVSLYL